MLTFFPEFEDSDENDSSLDVMLLVDCSNSMKGTVIELKKLVLLVYHLLPDNVRFNVVGFGEGMCIDVFLAKYEHYFFRNI